MDMIKIQKNGNGYSVMVPAHVMRALNLQRGDVLGCEVVDGYLSYEVIRKHKIPLKVRVDHRNSSAPNSELKA